MGVGLVEWGWSRFGLSSPGKYAGGACQACTCVRIASAEALLRENLGLVVDVEERFYLPTQYFVAGQPASASLSHAKPQPHRTTSRPVMR